MAMRAVHFFFFFLLTLFWSFSTPSPRRGKGRRIEMVCSPKHFVFVHGAGHGAWSWFKLRTLLEELGHTVTCLDLAGSGIDLRHPASINSFDEYKKPLSDFLSALPGDAKVVLVGHSAGGLVVTSAIHEFGGKLEAAVYVAANMLRNGFGTGKDFQGIPTMPVFGGRIPDDLRTPDGLLLPKYQRLLIFNQSPPEDATLGSMLLRPSPAIGVVNLSEGGERVDAVKRVYIKSLQDNLLDPKQQDMMIQMWPPDQVFSLESDHSPFFSTPSQLCEVLHSL